MDQWVTIFWVACSLGLFGAGSIRLLREKWKSATSLAQELYAMFQDDIPLTTNAPLTMNVPQGQSGLTINQSPFSIPPDTFNFTGAKRAQQAADSIPGFDVSFGNLAGDNGAYQFPVLSVDGPATFGGDAPVQFEKSPVVRDPASGAFVPLSGTTPDKTTGVVSPTGSVAVFGGLAIGGDSGPTFQVALYPNGPNADPGATVPVFIPQIDPAEIMPPNTWIIPILIAKDGSYYAQPPVWLA